MLFRCCCRPVLIPIFFTWAENVMIVNVNDVIIVMMMRYLILYPHLLHLLKIVMIIIFVIVITILFIIVLFIILFMVIRVVTNLILERPGGNVELFAHLQS